MKVPVNAFDYASEILNGIHKGLLVTTKVGDEVNSMTIGWGHIGFEWKKQIFVAYVRDSRYTTDLLKKSGEFTVNIPHGSVDSKILSICGTKSGRDTDKIKELGLTLEEPLTIQTPGIRELPLTLECKVIATFRQEPKTLPDDIQKQYYPNNQPGDGQCHVAYYGEIVNAYLITD